MGSSPSPPKPPPMPPPPKQVEEGPANAAEAERLRRLLSAGRSSTILTTPSGGFLGGAGKLGGGS
jgi:hypothetical protein